MIDYSPLIAHLQNSPLAHWLDNLPEVLQQRLDNINHGDFARWQQCLQHLPVRTPELIELRQGLKIGRASQLDSQQQACLREALMGLHPWRKGPFELFGVNIDCEWRSDWKWQRVAPHIQLQGKRVLDVGCGNGYYMWRMWGAGAELVVGVDPNLLFLTQFEAIKQYLPQAPVWQLPLTLEQLPEPTGGFDTVFSMGLLYHRRSPLDHLLQLRACLRPGGQLVLETLVVEGDEQQCLIPADRYAQMRNVWFLPSVGMLQRWLQRCGFEHIECVDLNRTSVEEQRRTEWMRFQSLPDFLMPDNHALTIEGYPAPLRATLLASRY